MTPATNTLKRHALKLRLSGLLSSLELRLQEAESNRLPYAEFLELIFQDELNVRNQRLIVRRNKVADFREARSLESFDFGFNTTINRGQVYQLATCQFVREKRDVLLVGPPGVGKSHIAQSVGREAVKAGFTVLYRSVFDLVRELLEPETQAAESRLLKRYLKPDLLIIDDMGRKVLPAKSGEILLEIIMRRYENRSTMMTSNRPVEEWGKLLCDVPAASAILDRLLHHAEIIAISGRSYQLPAQGGSCRAKPASGHPGEERQECSVAAQVDRGTTGSPNPSSRGNSSSLRLPRSASKTPAPSLPKASHQA